MERANEKRQLTTLLAESIRRQPHRSEQEWRDLDAIIDAIPESDILGGLTPGVTRLTNRDLATMMIAVSDNGATNLLIDRVGMDKVNAALTGLQFLGNQDFNGTSLWRTGYKVAVKDGTFMVRLGDSGQGAVAWDPATTTHNF